MSRIRLSEGHVAWWHVIPFRWRLFWTLSTRIPMPWFLITRGIQAEVAACHVWLATR